MLRRNYHIGSSKQRIRTGGINPQDITLGCTEIHLRAGRTSNPVFLGNFNTVNIIDVRQIQIVNQLLGIFCNFEHPLAFYLTDNLAAAAFADAVDHLFICQDAFAGGAPVDRHFTFIGKPMLEKLEENPLGPLVIARIGGVNFAVPVKGKP